jgi:hypothetical protein
MRCSSDSLHDHNRRGAVLSMELVLVLPLFLLLIFSLVEFSMLTAGQARVASAAQAGARYMSLSGAGESAVQERVAQVLGADLSAVCSIAVEPAIYVGETGYVTVSVPMQTASPDLLWFIGFGLAGRSLEMRAGMVAERCATPAGVESPIPAAGI